MGKLLSIALAVGLVCALSIAHPHAAQNPRSSANKFDGVVRQSPVAGLREAYLPAIFPSSHAANLLQLTDGTLLCFWFSGTWEGESGVAIVMSRLRPGSDHWSKPTVVDQQSGKSFQNPVGFEASRTELWLLHSSQDAGAGEANAHVEWLKSHDNGRTWSARTTLFDAPGAFTRHPLVVLSKESWLLPMYFSSSRQTANGIESNYSVTQITTDGGRTWTQCDMPGTGGLIQPSVLKLKSGEYVAFFRSRSADFIYRSTSSNGCAWSEPQKTILPNNNSSIQAVALQNGDIVMAFNNTRAHIVAGKPLNAARKPLTVAISPDGGIAWPWARDIEVGRPGVGEDGRLAKDTEREEYSYPSILQRHDGTLALAFTYRRATIKCAAFDEDWIKSGTTVGIYKPTGKINARGAP